MLSGIHKATHSVLLASFLLFSCADRARENARPDAAEKVVLDDQVLTDSVSLLNSAAQEVLLDGDTAKAMEMMERSLAINLDQYELEATLCYLFAVKKDPRSLLVANRLIRQESLRKMAGRGHYLKGIYFSNTGEESKALNAFDSSIINNFTFTDAYIEKAIILHDQKKFDEAITLLDKAVALNRFNADIYFWLGKCHQANRNRDEAVFNYEQALTLDSLNETARKELMTLKKQQ